jgi:signal transduction histidine kinase
MRIRDVSGDRLEAIRLRDRLGGSVAEIEALRAMLDAVPNPVWTRAPDGRLGWVNAAYVRAVEARDAGDAVLRGVELFDQSDRAAAARARESGQIWRSRAAAVVAGERRMLDVIDVPSASGVVGIATDVSELEAARGDLERQMRAHAATLDQLSTAVAIFDRAKRLLFHNTAYRQLWGLDLPFLESHPTDSEILDRLRAGSRLPEEADYRGWKAAQLAAYQSPETSERIWHLPGRHMLRVVTSPNPQGGVTYLFDDVTDRYKLESQFNALARVQDETLDTLREGVAVFGTDGRLKLSNPAFARLWRLDPDALAEKPHIDAVAALCLPLAGEGSDWTRMRAVVAGLQDRRTGFETRIECRDGVVLDCAAAPLPDGATLLTFSDVSAAVRVERALKERNQALIDAETLRNDFVHHVSYELRSPLTNIIGFIQLLGDDSVGPLNPKQREYAGYVTKSSAALLAIINDILDLATIDQDAMQLEIGDVDIGATIRAAAEGLQDRLAESDIHLRIVAMDDLGVFRADGKRVRQILFNLLSNAIGFSSPQQTVTLAALRRGDEIVFKVSDQGRGIPHDILDKVFDRFESRTIGSRHRGVGLGLSIVRSFVELHGGRVHIDSAPGEGTTVTCIFPAAQTPQADAARG